MDQLNLFEWTWLHPRRPELIINNSLGAKNKVLAWNNSAYFYA